MAVGDGGGGMTRERRRWPVYLVAGYAALQVVRLAALPILDDIAAGRVSPMWKFPAMTDVAIGVAALVIAWMIVWRQTLLTWTAAIVFFAISITDHLNAIVASSAGVGAPPSMFSNPTATVAQLAITSLIEIGVIIALATRLRPRYVGR